MIKMFLGVLADLFDNWSDGTNDQGDFQPVADLATQLVDQELDAELDAFLQKSIAGISVGNILGTIAKLLRLIS